MAKGAAWNVLFRIADRGIGLLSTIVLARLLVPADFGVVALAMSMIALLALLTAFGLDLALIQNPNAERRHFDTVWTLNVLFGLGTAVLLVLLAHPAASLYDESRLVPVIYGLAAARAISSFENVGIIAFRKEMAFDQEFKFSLIKRLATTFLATLPLAFIWRDYWALVGGTIAGSCFGLALSYLLHPYRPRPSLGAFREIFGFSKWLQLANIVGFVSGRSADFIIGKVVGSSALGSYTLAKEIAGLPTRELAMPIHRGVFPGYAKISGDIALLKRAYLRVTSVLVLVTLPAGIGLSLVAQPVVLVFLGNKWNDVVPLLQILAVNGVVSVSLSTAAYVYLALGTARRTASLVVVSAGVSLPLMLILVPLLGAQGAAYALLAGSLATAPVNYWMMTKAVRLTLRDIGGILWCPLTATLVMFGAVMMTKQYWTHDQALVSNLVNLATAACTGAAVYCGALALLWRLSSRPDGAEAYLLGRLKSVTALARTRARAWWTKTP